MYPRSPNFDAAYIDSHVALMKAEIWHTGGWKVIDLDIVGGQITVDDVAIRRTADVDLTDTTGELVPDDMRDLLAPRSHEIRLFRGIRMYDGTEELLPVGVYTITDDHIDDSGDGLHISLSLCDRAYRIARDYLTFDWVIGEGTNYISAIQQIINRSVPFAPMDLTPTSHLSPLIIYEVGQDPWAAARELASNCGQEIYFDPNGVCTSRPIPNYTAQTPVWNFEEGEDCTMLYINRRLTEQDSVNHVIVIGETADDAPPVRGEVFDDNPSSPTYVHGDWGRVVEVVRTSSVTTNEAAASMAQGIFQKRLGVSDLIRLNALVHPAFEIGDVVTASRETSKVDGRFVVDKISIPMTAMRPMDLSMRRRVL
jgi:hypothetical protein